MARQLIVGGDGSFYKVANWLHFNHCINFTVSILNDLTIMPCPKKPLEPGGHLKLSHN
jgi:hypothetical protein